MLVRDELYRIVLRLLVVAGLSAMAAWLLGSDSAEAPPVVARAAACSPVQIERGTAGRPPRRNLCASSDGRFLAFDSALDDLVADDHNRQRDVFLHDALTDQTICLSVDAQGRPGNGFSCQPAISADGRYVAFQSEASNLVAHDTNQSCDVFVFDTVYRSLNRISVSSEGLEGNGPSFVVPGTAYLQDNRIEFRSLADNLVAGDRNRVSDTFIYDLATAVTTRQVPPR